MTPVAEAALLLGLGALLAAVAAARRRPGSGPAVRFGTALRRPGARAFDLLTGAALGLLAAAVSWVALSLPVVSVVCALTATAAPLLRRRNRQARASREAERAWAAALDQLADALESGLAFPAAAGLVARAGPTPLRSRFATLVDDLRRGELERGLDGLAACPEQVARSVAALLRAALVELPTGGLAPLLRELARIARERFEAAERARIRSLALRREATVLAISPLGFLLLIGASAPGYLAAYRSPAGVTVSLVGAAAIAACYLAMLRLGRLPEPGRTAVR